MKSLYFELAPITLYIWAININYLDTVSVSRILLIYWQILENYFKFKG